MKVEYFTEPQALGALFSGPSIEFDFPSEYAPQTKYKDGIIYCLTYKNKRLYTSRDMGKTWEITENVIRLPAHLFT